MFEAMMEALAVGTRENRILKPFSATDFRIWEFSIYSIWAAFKK